MPQLRNTKKIKKGGFPLLFLFTVALLLHTVNFLMDTLQ
jgi:hypothetical protein